MYRDGTLLATILDLARHFGFCEILAAILDFGGHFESRKTYNRISYYSVRLKYI